MNYSDRVVQVGDKDKLNARATGLLVTIRKFGDAKWDWILGGAMKFADSRWKGSEANRVIRPAIEIEEPFLLSDVSAASDDTNCVKRVDLEGSRDHDEFPWATSTRPSMTSTVQGFVKELQGDIRKNLPVHFW